MSRENAAEWNIYCSWCTVHLVIYAHGFGCALFCSGCDVSSCGVMQYISHIFQGYFTVTGAIIWLVPNHIKLQMIFILRCTLMNEPWRIWVNICILLGRYCTHFFMQYLCHIILLTFQFVETTRIKHNKEWTICIFLGIYCIKFFLIMSILHNLYNFQVWCCN